VETALAFGLATAGIMDHDTMAGADEFLDAGEAMGLSATAGFECRCLMNGTPFEGRRVNNPDQLSVAYLAMHGVPRRHFGTAEEFLSPLREKRNERNKKMTARLNGVMAAYGLSLDFEGDVLPLSEHLNGGAVTERHILYALAIKMIHKTGRGNAMFEFIHDILGLEISKGNRLQLLDESNLHYAYTVLNILKSGLMGRFYADAREECPSVHDFIALGREIGGITAYAYLGDVTDSVTGDKQSQTFEDAYLDELFLWLKETGFNAVTYMPTRNTPAQLKRVMALCERYGLFQISGEDINSPFQSFICPALDKPEYRHLIESTYALVGHDKSEKGMFSAEAKAQFPGLPERIKHYAALGRG
jgi:hypothetical protein